jgi:DNA-binding transcriptional ArsR family regulator
VDFALPPDAIALIAERFRALGEPARLQLLASLREREKTVNELVTETGLGQANVSKHLRLLHALGFVARRKDGPFVRYTLADESAFALCDLACGGIRAQLDAQRRALAS